MFWKPSVAVQGGDSELLQLKKTHQTLTYNGMQSYLKTIYYQKMS